MRYKEFLKEDEYGRDQGAMYEPDLPENEEEFFQWIADDSAFDQGLAQRYPGEGTGENIAIHNNFVSLIQGNRKMGRLSSRGGNMILMHGNYDEMTRGEELIGAIKKSPEGFDVYFYKPGYVGTNKDLKSALDTLIIAAWG